MAFGDLVAVDNWGPFNTATLSRRVGVRRWNGTSWSAPINMPAGIANAEGAAVDPTNGDIVVVTSRRFASGQSPTYPRLFRYKSAYRLGCRHGSCI